MFRYTIILLWCLFFGFKIQAQVPDTLSLEQFMVLAQERNLNRKAADLDKQVAGLNYRIFQNSLKPQLAGTLNLPGFQRTFSAVTQPNGSIQFQPIAYNYSDAGLTISQPLAKTGGIVFARTTLERFDDFENNFTQYSGLPLRVGIEQPIFAYNPVKWNQQIEPLRALAADKKYQFDREQINSDAASLFANLLLVYNDVVIASTNADNINTLYRITQERYAIGEISERDLIQLELELTFAQQARQRAQLNLELVASDILRFLGEPNTRQVLIPALPTVENEIAVGMEVALNEWLSNRFEIVSTQIAQLQAASALEEAKRTNSFSMRVRASLGWAGSSMHADAVYTDAQDEQAIQVSLSVPIFDWGQRKDGITIAKAQQAFTQQKVAQDLLDAKTQVQEVVQQFLNLQQEVKTAAKITALANKRYEISRASYVLGAISLTELTFAQREKDQSSRDYIQVLAQYWQWYYALRLNTLYDFRTGKKINY